MKQREVHLNADVVKGNNALTLLDNPLLKDAFRAVRADLDERELATLTIDTESCKDIIRCKQLLAGIERTIYRLVQYGKVSAKELEFMQQKKPRLFSRM